MSQLEKRIADLESARDINYNYKLHLVPQHEVDILYQLKTLRMLVRLLRVVEKTRPIVCPECKGKGHPIDSSSLCCLCKGSGAVMEQYLEFEETKPKRKKNVRSK